jgi:hypothetical protein
LPALPAETEYFAWLPRWLQVAGAPRKFTDIASQRTGNTSEAQMNFNRLIVLSTRVGFKRSIKALDGRKARQAASRLSKILWGQE